MIQVEVVFYTNSESGVNEFRLTTGVRNNSDAVCVKITIRRHLIPSKSLQFKLPLLVQSGYFHSLQAGIIEEMMEDTFEGMEDDDLEEASQEELDKILFEVTKGKLLLFKIFSHQLVQVTR